MCSVLGCAGRTLCSAVLRRPAQACRPVGLCAVALLCVVPGCFVSVRPLSFSCISPTRLEPGTSRLQVWCVTLPRIRSGIWYRVLRSSAPAAMGWIQIDLVMLRACSAEGKWSSHVKGTGSSQVSLLCTLENPCSFSFDLDTTWRATEPALSYHLKYDHAVILPPGWLQMVLV